MTDDKMREAFEAWAKSAGHSLKKAVDGEYYWTATIFAWDAWQAAQARPADAPLFVFEHEDGRRITCRADDARLVGQPAWHRVGPVGVGPLNYAVLHEFAEANRVSYDELCAAVHAAMAATQARPVDAPTDAERLGWKWLKDTTYEERSWPEDAGHENGNYSCNCVICLRQFTGHKRRGVCRVCDAATQDRQVEAPTDAERLDARRWRAFRNRDALRGDLQATSFIEQFREDADDMIDEAVRATPADGGEG